jgi:U3 small nucleolar RNA-associated protein 15
MKEKEIYSTKYTKTELKPQSKKTYKNPEQKRFKKYKPTKEILFPTTACNICCCKGDNKNLVSIFGSNEISIYDVLTDTEVSKFNNVVSEKISTGIIRNDGKLILTGDDSGKIFIHEIVTKNLIRKYSAHTLSITSIDIDSSLVKFISASRDCSFKYFDMINEKPIKDYKKSHNDSIMVNKFFDQSTVLTGGHDKKIKLWDLRNSLPSPELIFDNSDKICDDLNIINDNYFCTTADNNIILYDIRKTNQINFVNPVKNTITKITKANNNTRLFLLSPGETFITVLDIADLSLRPLFNINLKNKIYAFDIEENLEYFVVGYDGGKNIVRTKPVGTLSKAEAEELEKQNLAKMQENEDEQLKLLDPMKYSEKPVVKNYRYFFRGQYKKNLEEDELFVDKKPKINLNESDKYIKKFQYQKALNFAVHKDDEIVFSIIDELVDRNTLKLALFNEDQNSLIDILKLVKKKIRNPSKMNQFIYLMDLINKYYGVFKGKNEEVNNLFNEIEKEINEEIQYEKDMIQLNSDIDSLVSAYQNINC